MKKVICILCEWIMAFYITYIINYSCEKGKMFFLIVFLIVLLSEFAVYKYLQKKELLKFEKGKFIFICIFSFLFLWMQRENVLLRKYIPQSISITATGESNEKSESDEVWLERIIINGEAVNFQELQISDEWKKHDNGKIYTVAEKTKKTLVLPEQIIKDVQLIFMAHSWSGNVEIEMNHQVETYDLYSEEQTTQPVFIKGNYDRSASLLLFLSAFISVTFILYVLVLVFENAVIDREQSNLYIDKIFTAAFVSAFFWRLLFYSSTKIVTLYPDSWGYMQYQFVNNFFGKMTSGRTPLYPLLIRICYYVFGTKGYLAAVTYIQIAFSWVGVYYAGKCIRELIPNMYIRILLFIFYMSNPSVFGNDRGILTESCILSLMPIILYWLIRYLKERKLNDAIKIISFTCAAALFRPSFLLYFILCAAFFILKILLKEEKNIKMITGVIGICCTVLFLWSWNFHRSFGFWSISDPLPRQNLYICVEQQYYKNSTHEEFVQLINQSLKENGNIWSAVTRTINEFGHVKVIEYTKECMSYKYLPKKMADYANDSFYPYYGQKEYAPALKEGIKIQYIRLFLAVFSIFNVSHTYVFSFLGLMILLHHWIKRKKIPWFALGFFSFLSLTVLASFMGTNAEYPRTMVCVIPIMYVTAAWWLGGCREFEEERGEMNEL